MYLFTSYYTLSFRRFTIRRYIELQKAIVRRSTVIARRPLQIGRSAESVTVKTAPPSVSPTSPITVIMAPAADRPGYWGTPTSTLDWCEENYVVSYYIAEFCKYVFFTVGLSVFGTRGLRLRTTVNTDVPTVARSTVESYYEKACC